MRRIKREKLTTHISSDYFEASTALRASSPTAVYVEGYEDVSFWRTVFDEFEELGKPRRFEVMTPARSDLAKGKKVVLSFAPQAGKGLILCVDSDFDRLFGQLTEQSRTVNNNPFVVQTYVYAIENLLCLPSSLSSIAARITRNDAQIFDFETFFTNYSKAIYPLFVWYFHAAKVNKPNIFTLSEFRNIVKVNYLDIENGGLSTVKYIERQVEHKMATLRHKYANLEPNIAKTEQYLAAAGVKPAHCHLYIQGHTLLDNVVKVVLISVCNTLRQLMVERIASSRQEPLTRRNDMSSYNNSLRDIDTVIADNTLYRHTAFYRTIADKIESILAR